MSSISRSSTSALTVSCSPHAHAATSTTVGSSSSSNGSNATSGRPPASSAARAPHLDRLVVEGIADLCVGQHPEPLERPERCGPDGRVLIVEVGERGGEVTPMARHDDGLAAPAWAHCCSRFVSQMTARATLNDTMIAANTPVTTPSPPLAIRCEQATDRSGAPVLGGVEVIDQDARGLFSRGTAW